MLFENYCLVVPCFKGIPLSLLGLQVFVYEVGKRMPPCNGVDRGCNITPHENGLTSLWSRFTRNLENFF